MEGTEMVKKNKIVYAKGLTGSCLLYAKWRQDCPEKRKTEDFDVRFFLAGRRCAPV